MELLKSFELSDVILGDRLQGFSGIFQSRDSFIQITLTIIFDSLSFIGFLLGNSCFSFDLLLLFGGNLGFSFDNCGLLVDFLRLDDKLWLQGSELFLHLTDILLRRDELLVTVSISISQSGHFLSLRQEKALERIDQFEVTCGGHVVVTLLELEETSCLLLSSRMEVLDHED